MVVAILVVGYFTYTSMSGVGGRDSKLIGPPVNQDEVNGNTNTTGKKMSFDSFLRQGGAYLCTVNQSVEGVESKGTVYVDGARTRGEFKTSVQGMSIDNIFVVKDGFSYSWSSMMPGKGYKVAVSGTGGSGGTTSGQYSFNAEQIGDYNCEAWSVDSSKFALPSGVVFTEIKN